MNKLITIPGELTEEGSVANKLSIKAAKEGIDLKNYIQNLLIKDSDL